MEPILYMVFDCESIGLHGESFAVGFVVLDADGNRHDCGAYACPPSAAHQARTQSVLTI